MLEKDRTKGILLFAHGSSAEEANRAVHELARQIEALGPFSYVRAAFLERARPDLGQAVTQAVEAGRQRLIVIPYFLSMGIHLQCDLPNLISALKQKYPEVTIEVGQALAGHPLLASIILGRVQEVMQATKPGQRADSRL
jgi:sirohydrochlorin ferrochelatase